MSSATATAHEAPTDQQRPHRLLPPMPLLPISSPDTIHRCKHLRTDARDIFICSYPKSGTTWTQALVHALITLGKSPLSEEEGNWHITEFCPFYEADRTWSSGEDDGNEPFAPLYARRQRETGRRAYNTHLRWDMMPTEGNTGARFLYLVRDGRDVAVSYYHHMRSMAVEDGGFEGTWDEFFDAWCEGRLAFGAWLDHLVSWCGGPAATDPRVLFLRYEDMQADLPGAIAAIAKHIHIAPFPTPAQIDRIATDCSLEGMRQERRRYEPRSVAWRAPDFRFIRKGQVGDHAALFSPEQQARFARGLCARYAAAAMVGGGGVGGEGGEKEKPAVVAPGVLPAYVTGALVGGEAELLRWVLQEGDGDEDGNG